jgi:Ca2+-binding EF-hand superfamily protein
MKRRWSDDEISTQLGASSSTASIEEVTSLPGSVEEVPMPSSTSSLSGGSAFSDEEGDQIEAKPNETRKMSITRQLHQMALLISRKAGTSSKYSGRVSTDVRHAFLAVDTNSDGKLTPTEMAAFCRHFDLTSETATRLFSLLDPDETGRADWSSFLARYAPVFRQGETFRLNPVDPFQPALQ